MDSDKSDKTFPKPCPKQAIPKAANVTSVTDQVGV